MKRFVIFFVGWVLVNACIDRINIPTPSVYAKDIVVDGLITDAPGPYTVRLSQAIKIDAALPLGQPVSAKKITMFDNVGNVEVLEEKDKGIYQTKAGGMQGVVGREYHIRIETSDGQVFESLPDKMTPTGAVDSIYYEFETHQPATAPTEYGYRIFIDAHTMPGDDYVRWKFEGTYVVETLPQFKVGDGCTIGPLPCSGYARVDGEIRKGYAYNPHTGQPEYVIGLECTCCRCWVTPREAKPKVNDGQLSKDGKYNKVEVGYVPLNFYTFFEKYRVEIRQMSLSRTAFDYWHAIQLQKEGIGSLFQPITGKIPTNLSEESKTTGIQGIFYASAVTKRQIYLDRNTHPAEVYVPKDCQLPPREGAVGEDCRIAFPGSVSTTVQPADWK